MLGAREGVRPCLQGLRQQRFDIWLWMEKVEGKHTELTEIVKSLLQNPESV